MSEIRDDEVGTAEAMVKRIITERKNLDAIAAVFELYRKVKAESSQLEKRLVGLQQEVDDTERKLVVNQQKAKDQLAAQNREYQQAIAKQQEGFEKLQDNHSQEIAIIESNSKWLKKGLQELEAEHSKKMIEYDVMIVEAQQKLIVLQTEIERLQKQMVQAVSVLTPAVA